MAKKSGYLQRRDALVEQSMMTAERITRQFYLDTMQIALARYPKLSLGYRRIMEITELCEAVRKEYLGAVQRGAETDVYRDHMDRELAEIMGKNADKLIRFEDRYSELKSVTY